MDIELLKTFLEVRNTRHFGRAAENLFITPAAVSARVKQLEEYFGASLFSRTRNNIQLTSEGERIVPHAEAVMSAWERTRQAIALPEEVSRIVSVGATSGLWHYLLQDHIADLYAGELGYTIDAQVHAAEQLLDRLMDRSLDVAFMYEPSRLPDITASAIGKWRLCMTTSCGSDSSKVAMAADYVYVDWGMSFGLFHAERFGDALLPALRTNVASVAEAYLLEHAASAYLPESVLDEARGLKRVKSVPAFARKVYAVYRSNDEKGELIQALIDQITV